jgi:integrase
VLLSLQIATFHRRDTAGMGRRESGTGSVYQRKDGSWTAQYKGTYRYAKTEKEARRKLSKLLKQADEIKPSNITVGTALDEYLLAARQNLKPRTITSYTHVIEAHLKPTLAKQKLHKLTALEIERLYAQKLLHLSPATIQIIHAVLSSSCKRALRLGLVQTNVCRDVERPKIQRLEVEIFTPSEVAAILSAAKYDPLEAWWVLALTGGLRQGEITGLQARDYDKAKGTLDIRRTVYNNAVGTPNPDYS